MQPARPFNSWDLLKVIALLLMFIDHLGAFFLVHETWLRSIGRGSAPIFLFLAGRASSYRFSWELFILGCLMTVSNFIMGTYTHPFDILFTILLSRAVFAWMEKRGKVIERPFEWFAALAVFILLSCFIIQYGTLGLLFAASGYMQRSPERYSQQTQRRFLIATLIAYAGTFILFFDMAIPDILLMIPVLCFNYLLMSRFKIRSVNMSRFPVWVVRLLTLSSHYSGYIYALHLIAISWITHYPL